MGYESDWDGLLEPSTEDEYQAVAAYRLISRNLQGLGHLADRVLMTLWEEPQHRQWILAALAGVDNPWAEPHNPTAKAAFRDWFDAFLYEELAIAKANLTLARMNLEMVR